ncbi:isochorismatase [Thozetella sp. PMI_491]|nr:isochorismatase [Thozetella sp. PMI_491]
MAPDLSFGPGGEQWHYTRATKTYDLTRGGSRGFTLRTTQGPADTFLTVVPNLSALVIVDMQNFFLDPSCRDHPKGLAAVDPTLKVIEKCRELGIQVVWLNWGLTDADLAAMPAGVLRGFARSLIAAEPTGSPARTGLGADLGDGKGRCLVAGEWNSAIYEPLATAVRPEDVHCAKNRMSGMWTPDQPLWKELSARGLRTVFFTGVNTDQCVLGTLVDAYNAGWDCVLVDDCAATPTEGGQEVCLHNISVSIRLLIFSSIGWCCLHNPGTSRRIRPQARPRTGAPPAGSGPGSV